MDYMTLTAALAKRDDLIIDDPEAFYVFYRDIFCPDGGNLDDLASCYLQYLSHFNGVFSDKLDFIAECVEIDDLDDPARFDVDQEFECIDVSGGIAVFTRELEFNLPF